MTASSGNQFSASDTAIAENEVHLWLCRVEDAGALDSAVLSDEERARSRRWQGEGRSDIDLGRTLLRHLLSRYAAVSASEWRFEYGRHGKPGLAGPVAGLRFNLSHSGAWLAVAVAAGVDVGVDVQEVDRDRPVEKLARRYFSAPEREDLEAAGGEFLTHFYRLWALKEALTKARGDALPGTLGSTAFRINGGTLLSLAPRETRGSSFWLLQLDGYALAVCGLSCDLNLRARQWRSGPSESPLELPLLAAASFG